MNLFSRAYQMLRGGNWLGFRRTKVWLAILLVFLPVAMFVPSGSTVLSQTSGTRVYITIDYPGASQTQAFGINNPGQVVGQGWSPPSGAFYNFLLDSTRMTYTPLPAVPNSTGSTPRGINDSGQIVGDFAYNDLTRPGIYGFLLSGGTYTALNFKPGYETTLIG